MAERLELSELSTDGLWKRLDVGAEVDTGYREVTRWESEIMPAGLSILIARLALTRGRPLPPGGVLLGIDLKCLSAPPRDGRYEFRTDTQVSLDPHGRTRLQAATALRLPRGRDVAEVTFSIRWPHA